MEYIEKTVSTSLKYHGVIVDVRLDEAELINGRIVKREVVHHPGGVTILPVDGNGDAWCVRQFRYPFGKELLEAPAGKLEPGENHLRCAERELSEETGFTADDLVYLGECYTSPGYSTEVLHIYLALGLHKGDMHLDENEFLNVEKHSLSELANMVMAGDIADGKTVIAVLKAQKYLEEL